tara:strand:+ start:144 stop:266 length:123 start_codon:yes stop_codon:yes gene_type:complete
MALDNLDNADYREDYIEHENKFDFEDELEELIDFFNKMNI